jgi:hypothetical protein
VSISNSQSPILCRPNNHIQISPSFNHNSINKQTCKSNSLHINHPRSLSHKPNCPHQVLHGPDIHPSGRVFSHKIPTHLIYFKSVQKIRPPSILFPINHPSITANHYKNTNFSKNHSLPRGES